MKLLTNIQLREADSFTIQHEPVASIDLMERAAVALSEEVRKVIPAGTPLLFFCGPGNNGGDGLAMARLLADAYPAEVCILFSDAYSPDFQTNRLRLPEHIPVTELGNQLPEVQADAVIVDALFGSGLSRPLEGYAASLVKHLSRSLNYRISLDIPSGLPADMSFEITDSEVFHADLTLTIQYPKLAFLFPENEQRIGNWVCADIGLLPAYLNLALSPWNWVTRTEVRGLLKPRIRFSHKGLYGHALVLAGSPGKSGAAVLASKAAMHTGCGWVTLASDEQTNTLALQHTPELMTWPAGELDWARHRFSAVAIGPGWGLDAPRLEKIFKQYSGPLVLDADALTLLAENPTWLAFLPQGTLLTPHPGEFDRMFGTCKSGWERVRKQREVCRKFGLYILLKGAYSTLCNPDANVWFNTTGNPGMATAGTGDVLTGMLVSLLAQGYSTWQAAILGSYLHGLSGDLLLQNKQASWETLTASQLIDGLPAAFQYLGGGEDK